ncbi:restriction endonuclease subunit S [Clostridium perfringens]|uniref:restriction endonuclease subunit S n=1 Tax=Clostridium perfringens TaxID=1502 RepID=UPI0024BD5C6C|nr:restriction endonuclease subunit S [Clostridium perfringens]
MSFKETEFGRVPSDWNIDIMENTLDAIIDYRGKTPKKAESGIETLSAKSVKNGFIDYSSCYYISKETYDKFMVRGYPQKGDILMTTEAPLGCVAKLDKNDIAIAQRLLTLRGKDTILDNDYLMYYLMSKVGQHQLNIRATGTTVLGIKQTEFRKVPILLPQLEEQKAIAKILSDLDEKVEINNKINKNLEEMAQAIFKQWFVDFEFPNEEGKPYKSSGGEMVESELGMIPKGFKIGFLRDYVDNILGGDWGKENEQGNYKKEVFCLRGADIPEVRIGKKGSLPKRYILEKNYNNKKLSSGDLVVEISGGSPTQSTGRISYINNDILLRYEIGLVCTNFCRAITLKNKKAMEYFYFCWDRIYNLGVFFQFENGTTGIKNLDVNTFLDKFKIVKPNIDLIEKFKGIVCDFNKTIQQNGIENERLEKLRDNLLPKLMSGEIRVPLENSEN